LFGVFILLLHLDMDNASIMVSFWKKFVMTIFWMGVAAFSVIMIDAMYNIPDEISGVLYFISIGIAASGTLNYYR
jgi:hypothetical protein